MADKKPKPVLYEARSRRSFLPGRGNMNSLAPDPVDGWIEEDPKNKGTDSPKSNSQAQPTAAATDRPDAMKSQAAQENQVPKVTPFKEDDSEGADDRHTMALDNGPRGESPVVTGGLPKVSIRAVESESKDTRQKTDSGDPVEYGTRSTPSNPVCNIEMKASWLPNLERPNELKNFKIYSKIYQVAPKTPSEQKDDPDTKETVTPKDKLERKRTAASESSASEQEGGLHTVESGSSKRKSESDDHSGSDAKRVEYATPVAAPPESNVEMKEASEPKEASRFEIISTIHFSTS